MINRDELIRDITEWVGTIREKENITPTPGRKSELSGIAHGEWKVFLSSLLYTKDGDGAWNDFQYILDHDLVEFHEYVKNRLNS